MSSFRIVNHYPHAIDMVWAGLSDPSLIPRWTATGRGAHTEGFEPTKGTHFRFVGKPVPGWDGVVRCEVLAVDAPRLLTYTWANHTDDEPTIVTYELAPTPDGGTNLTYTHTGFTGPSGLVMSKLLGRVRRKMLTKGLSPVLDDLTNSGTVHADTTSAQTPRNSDTNRDHS
jgi:uncharacterized protein YndB with AHSA1/START domain